MSYWLALDCDSEGVRKNFRNAAAAVRSAKSDDACMAGPFPGRAEARRAFESYRATGRVKGATRLYTKPDLEIGIPRAPLRWDASRGESALKGPTAWVDASADPKTGVSAWGGVILTREMDLHPFLGRVSGAVGSGSSSEAELAAVLAAIEESVLLDLTEIEIRTDLSAEIIGSLYDPSGEMGSGRASLLSEQVRTNAHGRLYIHLKHVASHAGDPGNELADALASVARLGGSISDVINDLDGKSPATGR